MGPMKYSQLDVARIDEVIYDRNWHLQQKLDGVRVGIHIDSTGVTTTGARGYPGHLAKVTAELTKLSRYDQTVRLDCELVNGKLWAFDLIEWGKHSTGQHAVTADTSWMRRQQRLDDFGASCGLSERLFAVVPTAKRCHDKQWLWDKVVDRGLEGVVAKHRDSRYRWDSRVDDVLKVKITHTIDCVVIKRNAGGRDNAQLALMKPDGNLAIIGSCSMIGKPDIRPGQVAEVKYLYAGSGGSLVQPTVLRARPDKRPADCRTDQLRFISREVLDHLTWAPLPRGTIDTKTEQLARMPADRRLP